ncbi:MAG TPA: ATP-binding protein [Cyanobacteria bacterium UBA8530]|nr:ATP-binding protein [Cyanobacteria bacterium UBA8530]
MKELSLHVLDIVENSVRAGARNVLIEITEQQDRLVILVRDDGCGMDETTLAHLFDPFFSSRRERRVGLGLSLFREAARRCGGDVVVCSSPGAGTTVKATFRRSHIDLPPLGDLAGTLVTLMVLYPEADFFLNYRAGDDEFLFSTAEMRAVLEDVPISHPLAIDLVRESFASWLKGRK